MKARMNARKLLVAALMIAVIAAFFAFDAGQYFRLEYFRSQQAAIDDMSPDFIQLRCCN